MIAAVNGQSLFYEVEGDNHWPAVLLIAGHGAQAVDWDPELVAGLTGAGYRVIRFDNRDSGLSSFSDGSVDFAAVLSGDHSSVPYPLSDMADDAAGLLRHLGIVRAHVVGHSMGAMIAQTLAIRHADQVLSLSCIAGTTGASDVGQPHPGIAELFFKRSEPGLTAEQRLDASVRASLAWSSVGSGTTVEGLRLRTSERLERNSGSGGTERQLAAVLTAPDRTAALQKLALPTLVIHGSDDPLIDISGGRATAAAVPGAELMVLSNVRHDLPPSVRPEIVAALVRHFAKA